MRTNWPWLLPALLLLGACDKDDSEDPAPTVEYGQVKLAFWFKKGLVTFEPGPGAILIDSDDRLVGVDNIRFLISNIRLRDGAGNVKASFPDRVILADATVPASTSFIVGNAPVGSYADVVFDIGLTLAVASTEPADHTTPPLSDATLYTDAANGYKFAEVKGRTDSDNNLLIQASDMVVSMKCTGPNMLREEISDWSGGDVVTTGALNTVLLDVTNLFNGISTITMPSTIGDPPANAQLMSNLLTAIQ